MACNTAINKTSPTGDLVGTTDTQTITNKTINIDTGGNQIEGTAWSILYTNGSGIFTELALGSSGQVLQSNGPSAAPSFATAAGSGDVTKVGTPVDNQVGVWTGNGTIEGTSNFTFDDATSTITLSTAGRINFGSAATYIRRNSTSIEFGTNSESAIMIFGDFGTTTGITSNTTAGPRIPMGSGSLTVPTYASSADLDTGLGFGHSVTPDEVSLIAGGAVGILADKQTTAVNIELFGSNKAYGATTAGDGVLRLNDVTTVPAGTLTSGGLLYVSETSLVYHDDAGVTTDLTNYSISQKSTAFTLALSDKNKFTQCSSVGGFIVTIPTNASVAFPIGSVINIQQTNTGTITIGADGGVTVSGINTATTAQWHVLQLVKVATDTWVTIG